MHKSMITSILCVSVFSEKHLLMPSSWSCSSIISPNPTVPHSTDWAGMDNFALHGAHCVPRLSLMLDSPGKTRLGSTRSALKSERGVCARSSNPAIQVSLFQQTGFFRNSAPPTELQKHSGVPVKWGRSNICGSDVFMLLML